MHQDKKIHAKNCHYDVAVLGGGPGGYVAAIRAAQMGARVALVEKDEVGGTCLNRGCIPTKALLKSAELYTLIGQASKFGIMAGKVSFDYKKMTQRKDQVVARLRRGIGSLLEARKIDLIKGYGRLLSNRELSVLPEGQSPLTISALNIVLATGSTAAKIPLPGADDPRVITTDEALALDYLPGRWVIIGGGVVGVEFAALYRALGCEVTLLEILPHLVNGMDGEVSAFLKRHLNKQGIRVLTGARVLALEGKGEEISVHYQTRTEAGFQSTVADMVLMAAGRRPNTDGLGLEKCGVALINGFIQVDRRMRTTAPGVYAIGDAAGGQLAHVAMAQGIVAAENACGGESAMDYRAVPRCIYTFPEIGSVGLPEEEAVKQSYKVRVGKFPFAASGRAQTTGESDGFVKIVSEETRREVLGVHIAGPHASELAAEAALAIKLGATAQEIADTIHAHPTISEGVVEAALAVLGRPLHTL